MIRQIFCVFLMVTSTLLIGCGSDQDSKDLGRKLGTDEDSFLQFCTEFPSSQECNEINGEADRLGLARYFGSGDDFFSDRAFGNSGMGCGCESDEHPVLYQGVRRCEAKNTFEQVLRSQVYLRYVSRPDGQKKLWVAFDQSTIDLRNLDDNAASCSLDFGSRCRLENGDSDCRGLINPNGFRVSARCLPLVGTDYGYCDDQGLGSRVQL